MSKTIKKQIIMEKKKIKQNTILQKEIKQAKSLFYNLANLNNEFMPPNLVLKYSPQHNLYL